MHAQFFSCNNVAMPLAPSDDADEIRVLLKKINDAWLKGPPEKMAETLGQCFADNLVIKGAGFKEMGRGKAECIKSYQDFVRQAVIRETELSEPEIDVFGDTAIANYSWEME